MALNLCHLDTFWYIQQSTINTFNRQPKTNKWEKKKKNTDGDSRRMPTPSILLKQKRHAEFFSSSFFKWEEKPILLFKYKQKFTQQLRTSQVQSGHACPPGISLALLCLFKNRWMYASCCSLAGLNCIHLAKLYFSHWACTTIYPFLLTDSNLVCDNQNCRIGRLFPKWICTSSSGKADDRRW